MNTSTCILIDGERPLLSLQEATSKLAGTDGELVLDFSAVQYVDSKALLALEDLARAAQQAQIMVVVRGVNVKVYKVMKLMRLASQFSFIN